MASVSFKYGKEELTLEIPDGNLAGVITPAPPKLEFDSLSFFRRALATPIGPKLSSLSLGKRVAFVVEDETRNLPELSAMAEALLDELAKGKPSFIHFLVATGTHATPANANSEKAKAGAHASAMQTNLDIAKMLEEKARSLGFAFDAEVHDCRHAQTVSVGITSFGTNVQVSKKLVDADLLVYTSNMKPHYFAGFSNPLKGLGIPGVCAYETIRQNHFLALTPNAKACAHPFNPGSGKNPVSEDMLEAWKLVSQYDGGRKSFVLADVSDKGEDGRTGIVWTSAGELEQVTRAGIDAVKRNYVFKAKPAEILIVGSGPAPYDKHFYFVHNAIELCQQGLVDGGEMLVISECASGLGPGGGASDAFVAVFKQAQDHVLDLIRREFKVGMQKAYKLGELVGRGKVNLFLPESTGLKEQDVLELHMHVVKNPQAWLDEKLKANPNARVLAVTKNATKLALVKE